MFQDRKVRISAALTGSLPPKEHFATTNVEGGVKFPKSPSQQVPIPQLQAETTESEPVHSRKSSIIVEEVMDEDLDPANKPIPLQSTEEKGDDGPILMAIEEVFKPVAEGINDWLEMADWMEEYVADSRDWLRATSLLAQECTSELAWKVWVQKWAQ